MAYVNFKNSPSEETPLTGGTTGNLNVMQENGTSHGTDTKLGYAQSFLNKHIINVSNEVDEDYRVNFLKSKNLLNIDDITRDYYYTPEGVYTYSSGSGLTDYMEVEANTEYVFKGISSSNSNRRINYFDSNKQWLSQDVQLATSEDVIITTPANTKYVRISYYSPTMNENTIGFYKPPFILNQIVVDNEKYSDTLNVGSVVDSRSRVNVLKTYNLWKLPSTSTLSGITLTNSGDGTIKLNGTATANADFFVECDANEFVNGINYYISSNIDKTKNTLIIANYHDTIYNSTMVNSNDTMPFVMNTTSNKVRLIIRCLSGKTFSNETIKIQLEEGSEETNWTSIYTTPCIYVDGEEIYSKPVVLWQNQNMAQSFAGQTITLNDTLNNYSYYEVIYSEWQNNGNMFNSGKIPSNMKTKLFQPSAVNYQRVITSASGNSMTFSSCTYYATYNNTTGTTENDRIVPYQVIGYK